MGGGGNSEDAGLSPVFLERLDQVVGLGQHFLHSAPGGLGVGAPLLRLGLRELVETMDPIPAMIQSRYMDVLAINRAGRVLLADFDAMPPGHRNIVRFYKNGRYKGTPFYVMEYIDGESLDRVLVRRGRFTWEEVVELGKQLCAALKHAHPERLTRGREIIERVKAAGDDPRVMKKNDGVFGNPGYHSSETPRIEALCPIGAGDALRW